nr:hypothetical protein [Candidatus Sigynarchaeota archaeon]
MIDQTLTIEGTLVLAGRVLLFVVYLVLFLFFRKNYVQSKKNGLPNKFSLGYEVFFGFLFVYGALSVLDEILALSTGTGFIGNLDTDFSVLYGITPGYDLTLPNLANPLYLIGIMILMLLLAAQVYPLEVVLGWKRTPGTIYLFAITIAIIPVFIPALSYSIYTEIVMFGAIGGVLIGLVLNIGINIRLAATTTGDLKKRSISIIFASILFYVGFLMALKIAEISILYQIFGTPLEYDIFLGCILQAIAAILYWRGLRAS